jgi:hypothetical protein
MKTNTVDVYIYVKSQDDSGSDDNMVNNVANVAGVVKAKINHHVKQLLAVEYNPDHVSSQEILASIKQRGVNAALIGM